MLLTYFIASCLACFAAGAWLTAKFSHRLGWQQGYFDACNAASHPDPQANASADRTISGE